MTRKEIIFVVGAIVLWSMVLSIILSLAIRFVAVQEAFLGGKFINYITNPRLYSWANFDGVYYLIIAQEGYREFTYFFFPLYPILVKIFSSLFGSGLVAFVKSGIFVSYVSLAVALFGLIKLLKLDFKENLIKNTILLLLIFPTSYYFGSVYTESLFLALAVWGLYLARTKKWILAGIVIALATATRIVGVALVAALAIEVFLDWKASKKIIPAHLIGLFISCLGIGFFVLYIWYRTGDPLNFFNNVGIFGAQRSSNLIAFPQVFYRYIFKILPNVNYGVLTSFFPADLEFLTGLAFLGLGIISFWKLRLSYAVYLLLGFIIPTLSGSFSSLPRYVLVLFPGFILAATYLGKNKYFLFAFCALSSILLVISLSLFARGYWIS